MDSQYNREIQYALPIQYGIECTVYCIRRSFHRTCGGQMIDTPHTHNAGHHRKDKTLYNDGIPYVQCRRKITDPISTQPPTSPEVSGEGEDRITKSPTFSADSKKIWKSRSIVHGGRREARRKTEKTSHCAMTWLSLCNDLFFLSIWKTDVFVQCLVLFVFV